MKQVARAARAESRVVGLVPTMGALHEGHLSLIRSAKLQCSPVVVSIFVNPSQFGPGEDFEKYPRQWEADRDLLQSLSVDYLFAPAAAEIYPKGFRTHVEVEGLSDRLEGRVRSRTLSRCRHCGAETFRNCAAAFRLFWPQGRAASLHSAAHGSGSQPGSRSGYLPHCPRARWTGDVLA